uniref:ATP synthase subunit a n=1 Tax=Metanigrus guttatus TaxID=3038047 RepID=A0AB38XZS4_9HEMI
MMMNLFSPFDPSTNSSLFSKMNWLSILLITIIMPKNMFIKQSRWSKKTNMIKKILIKEFKEINMNKQTLILSISLFTIILTFNINSLFPYTFTPTSHLSISLAMALPVWLMSTLFMLTKKTKMFLAHMIPQGTPKILMPFMIIIETVGMIIRPISLSVRLTANLTAGHLIMILLGENNKNMLTIMLILIIQTMLMSFELAISIIQAYVFSTISVLYSSEN